MYFDLITFYISNKDFYIDNYYIKIIYNIFIY